MFQDPPTNPDPFQQAKSKKETPKERVLGSTHVVIFPGFLSAGMDPGSRRVAPHSPDDWPGGAPLSIHPPCLDFRFRSEAQLWVLVFRKGGGYMIGRMHFFLSRRYLKTARGKKPINNSRR
jgi:hypothetical protein